MARRELCWNSRRPLTWSQSVFIHCFPFFLTLAKPILPFLFIWYLVALGYLLLFLIVCLHFQWEVGYHFSAKVRVTYTLYTCTCTCMWRMNCEKCRNKSEKKSTLRCYLATDHGGKERQGRLHHIICMIQFCNRCSVVFLNCLFSLACSIAG